MSLLQESIVYILLIPFLLQLVLPLAMLIVYFVSFPVRILFPRRQRKSQRDTESFTAVEHPA